MTTLPLDDSSILQKSWLELLHHFHRCNCGAKKSTLGFFTDSVNGDLNMRNITNVGARLDLV